MEIWSYFFLTNEIKFGIHFLRLFFKQEIFSCIEIIGVTEVLIVLIIVCIGAATVAFFKKIIKNVNTAALYETLEYNKL